MDPILCCILGICCPPFSAGQRDILTKALAEHLKDADKAAKIVDVVFDDFAKVTERLASLVKAQ